MKISDVLGDLTYVSAKKEEALETKLHRCRQDWAMAAMGHANKGPRDHLEVPYTLGMNFSPPPMHFSSEAMDASSQPIPRHVPQLAGGSMMSLQQHQYQQQQSQRMSPLIGLAAKPWGADVSQHQQDATNPVNSQSPTGPGVSRATSGVVDSGMTNATHPLPANSSGDLRPMNLTAIASGVHHGPTNIFVLAEISVT